jgi:hypothetical protein
MNWLLWFGLVVCLLAAAVFSLSAYGSSRWTDAMLLLTLRLEAARIDERDRQSWVGRYDCRELDGLPAPVQRYFRAVLKHGQPIIAAARVDLTGTFNMSPIGEQWKPFISRQRVVTRRPGFVWDAQVAMFPGVPVRVVDSYVAGEGLLRAALFGLLTVANLRGAGEIARGEFMRYFAETAWYPTALLPSQGVRWEPVDDTSARATMSDGPLTLTLLFRFNDAGLIVSTYAEARAMMVGKTPAQTTFMPWECSLSDYQVRDGMMVPMTGEAAWLRPEGRKSYFVGSVTSLSYQYSPFERSVIPTP